MNYVNKYVVGYDMTSNSDIGRKTSTEDYHVEHNIIDFGIRTISNQNSSKIIALPKTALANFGDGKTKKVNVKLVQQGAYTFIKLIPIFEK